MSVSLDTRQVVEDGKIALREVEKVVPVVETAKVAEKAVVDTAKTAEKAVTNTAKSVTNSISNGAKKVFKKLRF